MKRNNSLGIDMILILIICILFFVSFILHIYLKPEYSQFLKYISVNKYLIEPLYSFFYWGGWLSACALALQSALISVRRYWLFCFLSILVFSMTASLIVIISGFEELIALRLLIGFITYFVIFSFSSVPAATTIYLCRLKKTKRG